jgi:hypothetical protein
MARQPRTIISSSIVVAAFDQAGPRFICRDKARGHWVVVRDWKRALEFPDLAAGYEALADFESLTAGHVSSAGGDWAVYELAAKVSFRRP